MMEGLAVFFWGLGFGVVISDRVAWWNARKPTQEHLVGAKIIEAGKDLLFTRTVIGSELAIRNVTVLKIGDKHVSVTISDAEISA